MTKQIIKLKFQNGLSFEGFKKDVFEIEGLTKIYHFEESSDPDFIIFGPYGNDIPPIGDYIRIGYFCENIKPDFSICDWAFGVPHEDQIKNANYTRIQWHDTDPQVLLKDAGYDPENILASKTKFCNFLYETRIPYRESFFTQLSQYKKVDAPGPSMNNMPGINDKRSPDFYNIKRKFLSEYKFTIAFENDIFPGYQTEKLYDSMKTNSIPIYCGDPYVARIFNTNAFVNAADYLKTDGTTLTKMLEKYCQNDFVDIRPKYFKAPWHRLKRKVKKLGRQLKVNLKFKNLDYSPLIARIMELDQNDDKYLAMLREPWFYENKPPVAGFTKSRWIEIFQSSIKNPINAG